MERITVAEAAKISGLSQSTVRLLIEKKVLPGKYIKPKGGRRAIYLIYREPLLEHLAAK